VEGDDISFFSTTTSYLPTDSYMMSCRALWDKIRTSAVSKIAQLETSGNLWCCCFNDLAWNSPTFAQVCRS